ncbi:COMPASS component SDC1 [Lasiodiplodia hormozganensis]|uniref:COMPASS component SDC1 n=1 Tax=Lasiodiplodia hormozganensis TaxID=869390 RepID=A0AA39Z074_9PEZI|nr:COMPASS component SDC1 [Lasiodiplodia hormozganensis]
MADPNATPLPDGVDAQMPQHDATAAAATTNGTDTNGSVDVEMKEDTPADTAALPPAGTATAVAPVPASADTPGNATPPVASTSTPPPPTTAAPAPAAAAASTTSATMARTGSPRPGSSTPSRQQQQAHAAQLQQQQGQQGQQGQPQQQQQQDLPTQPNPHGSPTRVYLNQNVTPHLLEGMKRVALLEPEKPLKWLSDFLAERSKEYERD